MKKHTLKRIIAFTAALMLCASVASCGEKKTKTKTPQTADQLLTNSYKSIEMDAPEGVASVQSMTYIKESESVLLSCYDSDYKNIYYTTDIDFSFYTELNLNLSLDETAENNTIFAPAEDGTLYVIVTTVTHGDIAAPDWKDPDFDYDAFDYEAYEAAAEYSVKLCSFDSNGELLSENPISGMDKYIDAGSYFYVNNATVCGDDKIFLTISSDENAYVIMNTNGVIQDEIDLKESNWINYLGKAADGTIICDSYGDEGEELRDIDIEKKTFGEKKVKMDNTSGYTIGQMITGSGDYQIYLPMNTGLYGLKNDDSMEEIINWIDSDITGDYISAVLGLDNGDFIVFENNYQTNTIKLNRLTRRDVSELADTKVMTLGVFWSDSSVSEKVTAFNKTSDEYRIKIVDYSVYYEYNEAEEKYDNTATAQLKNDIIAGKAPDMIYISDYSVITSLYSKGVFADLGQLMENDTELNKDMFLPNIIDACTLDGKIYSLPLEFSVASYVAKSKFVDKVNWTFDDMVETYNNLPEDVELFRGATTKLSAFYNICYTFDEFVDQKNKTCSFDSPEFIKYLEFCNNFADEEEVDYESMTDEEMNQYWADQEMMCLNDKAIVDTAYMYGFKEYKRIKDVTFGGEDITFVGYPTNNGNGSKLQFNSNYAILDDSGCKDAAWSFIKSLFKESEDSSGYVRYSNGLSSLKTKFDKDAEDSMQKSFYIDENGEKVEYDDNWYIGGQNVVLEPLTKEEKDFFYDYVTSVTAITSGVDEMVNEIITEEIQAYFKGEKSAEDAAKMIQNRASILISEQG